MSNEKQVVFTTQLIEEIVNKHNKGYVIPRSEKFWYSNMVNCKKDGITFSMSDEELQEYIKCSMGICNVRYITKTLNDVEYTEIDGDIPNEDQIPEMSGIDYFSEKYCKIKREDGSVGNMKLRDYQKDILNLYANNRFSILCGSRQIGKCFIINELCEIYNSKTNTYINIPLYKMLFKTKKNKDFYDYIKHGLYSIINFLKYF